MNTRVKKEKRVRLVGIALGFACLAGLFFFTFKNRPGSADCANSISCLGELAGRVDKNTTGIFEGQRVMAPEIDFDQKSAQPKVLGETTPPGQKHIYVNLTTQTLTAYQGDTLVLSTLISSGKSFPTPTGEYTIWIKVRAQRMTGGVGGNYYDLPNVPYVMFFYNREIAKARGFSLHGAYWHNNYGYPMSHGCVNMRITDAEALYKWADPVVSGNSTQATEENPGTPVTIFGTSPVI